MFINLKPNEDYPLSIRGKTVVYLSGGSKLLVEAKTKQGESVGRFEILAGNFVETLNVFDEVVIRNVGDVAAKVELLIVEGSWGRLSDVSIVQIQGITNAITANIATMPAVKVSTMPSVEVSALPEVVQKDVSNVLTTSFSVTPLSSVSIPARAGRKRLSIQAHVDSLETTICRLSDDGKTAITGQIMACGGGLLAELEHYHSAGLKFWNPSESDVIELIIEEEF